jgi:hypothetical protein
MPDPLPMLRIHPSPSDEFVGPEPADRELQKGPLS